MYVSGMSFRNYISATAFYFSNLLVSSSCADDVQEFVWRDDVGSIHVYGTKIPWRPINLDGGEKNHFAVVAWTVVLSIAVSVAAVVCICCICFKFYPKRRSRRQSSNAVLFPPASRTVAAFQTNHNINRNPARTGNSHSRGVVNFGFVGNLQRSGILEDGPPAYSTVISETPADEKPSNSPYPSVNETKSVETPPPAYNTVAPFS